MPDAFISYRRIGSLSLAYLLQEMLKNNYNLECYLDVTHSSNVNIQFDDRLMRAIENAPIFICLLNKDTLNSKPVLKEIRKAYELKKPCIPVFQEGYEIAEELGLINLDKDGELNIWCRHPLAYLVEAADTICYRVIDIEDTHKLGFISTKEAIDLLSPIWVESKELNFDKDFITNKYSEIISLDSIGLSLRRTVDGKIEKA